jgi:predicted metal-binding membrane protein
MAVADRAEGLLYAGAFAALVGGAWLALGLLGASAYAPYVSHEILSDARWPAPARVAIFVGGWLLMTVAMMLPSSLPLVTVFRTVARSAPLVALLLLGYLWIWTLFGLLAFLVDGALHIVAEESSWLAARPHAVPAAVLLTAGLFQFSPLKQSCLEKCRSPLGFVIGHWRDARRRLNAFTLGVRHGLFCLGCCWALMLLMFGASGVDLGWMLALGAVMFLEKAVRWGTWVTKPVGGVLTVWGLALLLRIPGVPRPF